MSKPKEKIMRGCLSAVLLLFGIGFVFCKIAGIGDVKDWPWLWVLSPFYPALLVGLYILGYAACHIAADVRDERKRSTQEGSIGRWLRERKAKKWAKDNERWRKSSG